MNRLASTTLIATVLFGLSSTGCAAKMQARATASWSGHASGHSTPAPGPGCSQPSPAPTVSPEGPQPQVFGVPLAGAQDVVFVLDCSGSMTADATAGTLPSTPFAAIASIGLQASSAVQAGASRAPSLGSFLAAPPALPSPAAMSPRPPREDKLQAAKAELMGALGTLPDSTRFNIVYFDDSAKSWAPGLVSMNVVHRVGSVSFVNGIPANGSTAAVPALRSAYQSRPARVVFLSDGLANTGGDRSQLLQEARMEMRRGVRFDTVGLGADQDAELLQAMARESGGVMVAR
jgi:hypothetical protein